MGMICTRTHVLDALSGIANDYAGANTEDWWLWYDAHRQESEGQWVRDGFLRIGLSVDLPLDDSESRALLGLFHSSLRDVRDHFQLNAERWLNTRPQESLRPLLPEVLAADDQVPRRGGVRYLAPINDDDSARQLCGLVGDSDPFVSRIVTSFFQYYASKAARASCPAAKVP
jgi:hypothetical protein